MRSARKYAVADRIAALDAERDCAEIARLLATREFPWDITRALELALYRTYCVPSIGGLLDATKEFEQRPQKRYDDTVLILAGILENGLDSSVGRASVRRLNRIHGRFDISNDDFRYVLATFVVVPMRWLQRFGWRPVTEHERVATANYYGTLGRRMGIKDLPATWPEYVAIADAYEAEHFAYTPANARVGRATRELFVRWFWFVPAPLVRLGVHALLDDEMLRAFGFRPAPRVVRRLADLALRARGRIVRLLPARRRPVRVAESWTVRSYPDGYLIDELGPDGSRLPGATEPKDPAPRATASADEPGHTG